jgi:hypothetical protein
MTGRCKRIYYNFMAGSWFGDISQAMMAYNEKKEDLYE